MQERMRIVISTSSLFKIVVFGLALYVAYMSLDIIGAVLLAVVIAAAIEPPIRWMADHKVPRVISVLIVYVLFIIMISLALYSIIPQLTTELRGFIDAVPQSIDRLTVTFEDKFPGFPANTVFERLKEFLVNEDFTSSGLLTDFFRGVPAFFGGMFMVFITFVLSFYLAIQENGIAKFLRVISPEQYDDYVVGLWGRTQRKIERWLQGQLVLAVIVGLIVYVGLLLMGVQYALMLALVSAVFEIIPFFGPVLAAIPAIVIASVQSPMSGLLVVVLYILVQQLENHVLYPIVMRKMTGVAPMVVILALLVGGRIAGFTGLILAIPAVVIILEILGDREQKKRRDTSE
jgi:predicted PurR-regulated permease PerM